MAKKEAKDVVKEENTKEKVTVSKLKKETAKNEKKTTKDVGAKTTKNVGANSTKEPVKKRAKNTSSKNQTDKTASKSSAVETGQKAVTKKKSKIAEKEKITKSKEANTSKAKFKTMLTEYYDLPYRYSQTIVKILAQTPTTLFVYWDISDEDRNSLILTYGENFFNETRPVLVVHNLSHNYSFEVEINDFANSWYIRSQEPNSNYIIELGRRYNNLSHEYIYIDSSNNMTLQNDHILFEKSDLHHILFRNVKTHELSARDFGNLKFINNIDKLYGNIYDVYSTLYNDELLNLNGPSSGEFILKR